MQRKNDAHQDELEGVAQHLRNERPEVSPLELDRIKTTAMSRAQSGPARGRADARRLAVASLTVGLIAAGTGGVIASVGSGPTHSNAAIAQYSANCANNSAGCNENSFNKPPASGVQGSTTTKKPTTSSRHIKIHIKVPHKTKLKKVTIKVNGKVVSVFKGKKASANINLVNLPCATGTTTVTITAVTSSGKHITQSHTYHLCQA
jgi:hypothetical protein